MHSPARATAACPCWLVAVVFVVAGLGFRITAVPFHFYAPDVYQGTSAGVRHCWPSFPNWLDFLL